MPAKNRGRQPPRPQGKVPKSAEPLPDFNHETPKFCLHYLCGGFDVHALEAAGQAALARTLQKLAASRWKDLITAPRHGQGAEHIPAGPP
jgi:hypothetical protein